MELVATTKESKDQTKSRLMHWVLSPYRALRALCFGIGLLTLLVVAALGVYAYTFYRSLPRFDRIDFAQARSIATARTQARLDNKNAPHPWVELKDVSRDFLYSIVMSEDSSFFEHDGIDFDSILVSLVENIREHRNAYGASTLSQQVSKNLFLDQSKTAMRKIKEVFITKGLERRFSKNQILELYLNVAEFGPDIFGAATAAQYYFKKKPSKINAAEGAFLALLLPSPRRNHYAIFENKNMTKPRRRRIQRVLNDMLYNEFISEKQYRQYLKYDFFPAKSTRSKD